MSPDDSKSRRLARKPLPRGVSKSALEVLLTPELPSFQKKSQWTLNTVNTSATDDFSLSTASASNDGMFIPGINGKARCLQKPDPPAAEMEASRTSTRTNTSFDAEADRTTHSKSFGSSRRSTKSAPSSSLESNSLSRVRRRRGRNLIESRQKYSSMRSLWSADDNTTYSGDLELALNLYDEVLENITSRHTGVDGTSTRSSESYGTTSVESSLEPEEVEAMLDLLEEDTIDKASSNRKLKDEVASIRNLLNEHCHQRKELKRAKSMRKLKSERALGSRR